MKHPKIFGFYVDTPPLRCDSYANNTRQAYDLWLCSNRRVTLFRGKSWATTSLPGPTKSSLPSLNPVVWWLSTGRLPFIVLGTTTIIASPPIDSHWLNLEIRIAFSPVQRLNSYGVSTASTGNSDCWSPKPSKGLRYQSVLIGLTYLVVAMVRWLTRDHLYFEILSATLML